MRRQETHPLQPLESCRYSNPALVHSSNCKYVTQPRWPQWIFQASHVLYLNDEANIVLNRKFYRLLDIGYCMCINGISDVVSKGARALFQEEGITALVIGKGANIEEVVLIWDNGLYHTSCTSLHLASLYV